MRWYVFYFIGILILSNVGIIFTDVYGDDLDVQFECSNGMLLVTVSDNSEPLSGVKVMGLKKISNTSPEYTLKTDEKGQVTISPTQNLGYVWISKGGFNDQKRTLETCFVPTPIEPEKNVKSTTTLENKLNECSNKSAILELDGTALVYGLIEKDSEKVFLDKSESSGWVQVYRGIYNYLLIKPINDEPYVIDFPCQNNNVEISQKEFVEEEKEDSQIDIFADLNYCRFVATIKICYSVEHETEWTGPFDTSFEQKKIIEQFENNLFYERNPLQYFPSTYQVQSVEEMKQIIEILKQQIRNEKENDLQLNKFMQNYAPPAAKSGWDSSVAESVSRSLGSHKSNTAVASSFVPPTSFDFDAIKANHNNFQVPSPKINFKISSSPTFSSPEINIRTLPESTYPISNPNTK